MSWPTSPRRMESSTSTAARRASEFKAPPQISQDERRLRALQEQKRRRALRINAARNIDDFSALSLGADESDEDENENEDEDESANSNGPQVVREGLGSFASLLQDQVAQNSSSPSRIESKPQNGANTTKRKRNRTKKKKKQDRSSAKFANVCMYAELLELKEDSRWNSAPDPTSALYHLPVAIDDGLPDDLEHGWVALAPVPKGKRCLAVSVSASSGHSRGHTSNIGATAVSTVTHLHSRLKGATLLKFPSPLPPDSILDCILDANWEQTGIIHVLDILRWRGSDFMDCEAEFRFWWRDARLSEIVSLPPLRRKRRRARGNQPHHSNEFDDPTSSSAVLPPEGLAESFEYPFLFVPVSYHIPPISLETFLNQIIPAARLVRTIDVPVSINSAEDLSAEEGGMELDEYGRDLPSSSSAMASNGVGIDNAMAVDNIPIRGNASSVTTASSTTILQATIDTDGLLLYVLEASYQPGESPLSCWIPAAKLDPEALIEPVMLDVFERLVKARLEHEH